MDGAGWSQSEACAGKWVHLKAFSPHDFPPRLLNCVPLQILLLRTWKENQEKEYYEVGGEVRELSGGSFYALKYLQTALLWNLRTLFN